MVSTISDSAGYYVCKSKDEKPKFVENGIRLCEMDTRKWYIFDSEINDWVFMYCIGKSVVENKGVPKTEPKAEEPVIEEPVKEEPVVEVKKATKKKTSVKAK